jgi:hypothetical protein
MEERCGTRVEYRIAETPVFLPLGLLEEMAAEGAQLTRSLMANAAYLAAARKAIPAGYALAGETAHPNFLTADFALVRDAAGELAPRLVEIQAFPSVYGYQDVLSSAYRDAFGLPKTLGCFLGGLDEAGYWSLLEQTVLGGFAPENVVLMELDPLHQKTLPDFKVTVGRLGIALVDIRSIEPIGNKLHYRDSSGRLIPIHRIYNRAIADELMARQVKLPFDLTRAWDVKLDDFLEGPGREQLAASGVALPAETGPDTVYGELLLKPLFSFAGKGIQFDATRGQLEAIPESERKGYLLQQRMRFESTIETPKGLTQAEIRILYMWPDRGSLTPALSLVRLGRGKMMGVDHNRNQEWVGASAAFYPRNPQRESKQ